MALIKCRECGREVSTEAAACPGCGAPIKAMAEQAAAAEKKTADAANAKKGCLGCFGILILFILVVAIWSALSPSETPQPKKQQAETDCANRVSAFVMSQEFVKRQLRAPATAKFPSFNEGGVTVKYLGECTHDVNAFVDAENGFSALIRTNYHVKLRNQKGSDKWIAEAVELEQQ
jgi:hypothetical protein